MGGCTEISSAPMHLFINDLHTLWMAYYASQLLPYYHILS